MNLALRHQLTALDRALLALLDERARLACEAAAAAPGAFPAASVDDLLARSSGDFPAAVLRELFGAVDRGCREAAARGGAA